MNTSNNAVLITGGATGIGYALAESFIKAGSEVLICGRRKNRLMEVQKKYPKIKIFHCDISKEDDRKKLLEYVEENFPNLNILINNAGIQRDVNLINGLDDLLRGEDELKINLEAPIHMCILFVPFLLNKKSQTYIINVSSGLGFTPAVRMPIYSTTKAGLHVFTKCLRQQLINAKSSMKVIEIIPPAVESELNIEGRKKRGASFGTKADEFVAAVMKQLIEGKEEIGYGFTDQVMNASKKELDERFQSMNARMQ